MEYLRQNPPVLGPELSQLWQGLVEVYKKDQFDFYSQIIAFCALLRSQRPGVDQEAEALDRVRADHCLCRLQLLSAPCPDQCSQRHDSDRWRPCAAQQQQQHQLCRLQQYQAGHSQQLQQQQQRYMESELPAPPPPPPPSQLAFISTKAVKETSENKVKQSSSTAPLVQRVNKSSLRSARSAEGGRDVDLQSPLNSVAFDLPGTAADDAGPDAYSRILQRSKQQQELRELTRDGALHQSRGELLSATYGLAEERLRAASHSDHVSERYERLLHQHQHQGINQNQHQHQQAQQAPFQAAVSRSPSAREAVSTSRDTMSSRLLPAQQTEPPPSPAPAAQSRGNSAVSQPEWERHRLGSTHSEDSSPPWRGPAGGRPFPVTSSVGSAESASATGQGEVHTEVAVDAEEQINELSSDIDAFLQHILQHRDASGREAVAEGGEDTCAPSPKELMHREELETRWLLAAEEIRTHIVSSPQAEDIRSSRALRAATDASAGAGAGAMSRVKAELALADGSGNMRSLRTHIDKTMFDHLRRTERNIAIVYLLYRSLVATSNRFQEQALATSDAALQHLSGRSEEVRAVRKDIRFGTVCLQVHEKSMGQLEVNLISMHSLVLINTNDSFVLLPRAGHT